MVLFICLSSIAQIIIIVPQYDEVRGYSDGLAAVKQKEGWGFIDINGKLVVPFIYKDVRDFHEGRAAVKTEKGWGYIDKKNQLIISDKYFDAKDFNDGLAAVKVKNDTNEHYSDGYDGEKWGHQGEMLSWIFINSEGKIAFDDFYSDVSTFHDGVACVFKDKSWEYVNSKGESVSKVRLENLYPLHYSNGLIPNMGGKLGDEWGYSDLSGKWIIQPQYRSVSEFCDGIAVVEEFGGNMKVIDNKGIVLFDGVNDLIAIQRGGFFIDGKNLYNRNNVSKPYAILNSEYNFYNDVVSAPSIEPGGASVTVSYKSPLNIQSVEILRSIKAISFKQPCNGLWATEFDNGYWGYTSLNMKDFISQYVASQMKEWLKKGEFESTSAYNSRTSEKNRQQRMVYYADDLINNWLKKGLDEWSLSNYDADHETYALTTDIGQYVIQVSSNLAKRLKENWQDVEKTVSFAFNKEGLTLESLSFKLLDFGDLVCKVDETLQYDGRDVTVDMTENSLAINIIEGKNGVSSRNEKKLSPTLKPSDVDLNIPTTTKRTQNTFAIIFGNELYQKVAQVPFANHDAKIFSEYCKKTLGLPEKNVKLYENATYGTMIGAVSDMQKIAKAYKGEANFIFYYAGHGIPDDGGNDSYLLPVDADGMRMEACYPLSRFYRELGELQAKSIMVFLDACFSGAQRGSGMVVAARGVAIKVNNDRPKGNTIVFTAASEKQTAFPYEEKGHGMFTYYILKKLRETKGNCTLGELGTYVCDEVAKQAVVTNGKEQTPIVLSSQELENTWQKMRMTW